MHSSSRNKSNWHIINMLAYKIIGLINNLITCSANCVSYVFFLNNQSALQRLVVIKNDPFS